MTDLASDTRNVPRGAFDDAEFSAGSITASRRLAGFIASTLVRRLLAVGHTVHAVDIATAMHRMTTLRAAPGGRERLKAFQVWRASVTCDNSRLGGHGRTAEVLSLFLFGRCTACRSCNDGPRWKDREPLWLSSPHK